MKSYHGPDFCCIWAFMAPWAARKTVSMFRTAFYMTIPPKPMAASRLERNWSPAIIFWGNLQAVGVHSLVGAPFRPIVVDILQGALIFSHVSTKNISLEKSKMPSRRGCSRISFSFSISLSPTSSSTAPLRGDRVRISPLNAMNSLVLRRHYPAIFHLDRAHFS